jgi:ribosome-binding protein aMBF1 (putative translation factor)
MAHHRSQVAGTLIVDGVEYVVIPKADYLRMQDAQPTSRVVDAHAFVRGSIATDLRAAREHAGLTQAELAKKMGKSQTMISQAESGTARISERYVHAVLKACGLPVEWHGARTRKVPAKKNRERNRA